MIRKKYIKKRRPLIRVKANHQVRYPQVRVLSDTGEMLGIMSSRDAFFKAREVDKDLVLITEKANPPVVRIIDLAKFKYQQQQKEARSRKAAKKQDIKGVQFSPFMGQGDFQSRLRRVIEFLEKGHKVKLQLLFKGRQITKKNFGFDLFNKVIAETSGLAKVEIEPKLLGKKLIAQLQPITKKETGAHQGTNHEKVQTENS